MRRLIFAVFTLASLLCAAPPVFQRDWRKFPAIIDAKTNGADLYAIGDAHSDYVRLARVMRAAGLIDQADHWTGGKAVLVTTGDMIDKGPRALDVLHLLRSVRDEAQAAGGRVIILAGNHEAEFLANPLAPKGEEFARQLKAANIDPVSVGRCEGEIGQFLCSLSFGARVDDWFFSHAGNTDDRTVSAIEADIRNGLAESGYKTKELIGNDSLLEARLDQDGPNGKPWLQERMPTLDEKALLKTNARELGVAHIVEGHKPAKVEFLDGTVRQHGEMFQRWGLFFLIDTGMSEGVGDSHGAALWISEQGSKATAVCPDGTKTLLWSAAGQQDVGRAAPCK
jgi:Calcineurin-like phosphoesterase